MIMVCGLKALPALAFLLKLIAGKRCIVQVQSPSEVWEDISVESLQKIKLSGSSWLLRGYRNVRKGMLKRMDAFVAVSPEICRELISMGIPPEKIQVIPNGINVDQFHPIPDGEKPWLRRRLALPTEKKLFIFVGRLAATKGLPILLEAWKELANTRQDVHLLLVGSGRDSFDDCEPALKAFVKTHALESSVSFTGDVRNVHEYLQASDVFLLPSEYEGFSLALGEALACGLPVIATRVGAAPELIRDGENGILINPRDRKSLLMAMEKFLTYERPWKEMAMCIARNVVGRYGIETVAKQYRQVITGLQLTGEIPKVTNEIKVGFK
jgi:glycosyltransferase involved in cell wall biosynthesis